MRISADVTWNGLPLAGKLFESGQEVRIFLMNDSVDMARCGIFKDHLYFDGAEKSIIPELAEWVIDSDKVITFSKSSDKWKP